MIEAEAPPAPTQCRNRQAIIGVLLCWFLAVGGVTRLVLAVYSRAELTTGPALAGAFLRGAWVDAATAAAILVPLAVLLALLPRGFFATRWGRSMAHAGLFLLLAATLFVAVAEFFFWDEFGVRFNFIAVDYLIYTQEVIGNIRESYPMGPIFAGIAAASLAAHVWCVRKGWFDRAIGPTTQGAGERWRAAACRIAPLGAVMIANALLPAPSFENVFVAELAKNGPASFVEAFGANRLDYDRFYAVLPPEKAFARMREELGLAPQPGARDLVRTVRGRWPERRLNVIQITVESLSAEFLARYDKSARGLTPGLDALAARSLVFDRLYATGTRTDRGMEALSLSVPPTPGRSLIKRPRNENLFTLGSVLQERGYATAFVYGGYGYFDNMNHFFGGNGYRVVDRASVPQSDVTFANAWGACDEDLFRWTLREADADHAKNRPFFHFVMTTSNHRPYTYPDGKIDLPSKVSRRAGAVKYTDHAITAFLREAETHPWYRDTLFVIVADHCASSAGKTSLPVDRYHIPMLIFAPGGQVEPGVIDTLCSQIDYAPTLLGLLGGDYPSRFFGRDVLAPASETLPPRAYIANYQNLGLFDGERLAVLAPHRVTTLFKHTPDGEVASKPDADSTVLIERAIAAYQTADDLFARGGYGAIRGEEVPANRSR